MWVTSLGWREREREFHPYQRFIHSINSNIMIVVNVSVEMVSIRSSFGVAMTHGRNVLLVCFLRGEQLRLAFCPKCCDLDAELLLLLPIKTVPFLSL